MTTKLDDLAGKKGRSIQRLVEQSLDQVERALAHASIKDVAEAVAHDWGVEVSVPYFKLALHRARKARRRAGADKLGPPTGRAGMTHLAGRTFGAEVEDGQSAAGAPRGAQAAPYPITASVGPAAPIQDAQAAAAPAISVAGHPHGIQPPSATALPSPSIRRAESEAERFAKAPPEIKDLVNIPFAERSVHQRQAMADWLAQPKKFQWSPQRGPLKK